MAVVLLISGATATAYFLTKVRLHREELFSSSIQTRGLQDVMANCVKSDMQPDRGRRVSQLIDRINQEQREFGWFVEDTNGVKKSEFSRLGTAVATENMKELVIPYDYRDGELILVPVIDPDNKHEAGRSAIGPAAVLDGAWGQSNRHGCIIHNI